MYTPPNHPGVPAVSDGQQNQFSSTWMNFVGGFIAISVTIIVAAQTLIPYFQVIPEASQGAIGQQITMFQTVFIMVVSFFFGATVGARIKDATAAKQADTIARQVVAPPSSVIPLAPGESTTVKADPTP
jgi:hypothetical protein